MEQEVHLSPRFLPENSEAEFGESWRGSRGFPTKPSADNHGEREMLFTQIIPELATPPSRPLTVNPFDFTLSLIRDPLRSRRYAARALNLLIDRCICVPAFPIQRMFGKNRSKMDDNYEYIVLYRRFF